MSRLIRSDPWAALAILLGIAAVGCGPRPVVTPYDRLGAQGATPDAYRPLRPEENGLRSGRDGRFDLWWFDLQGEDGIFVVATFHWGCLVRGMGSDPLVELAVYQPGRPPRYASRAARRETCTAERDRCRVRIGESSVEESQGVYRVRVIAGELEADLEFRGELPGGTLPSDELAFGADRKLGWVIPLPRARVEGSLTLDGQVRRIRGWGYHDHAWGNTTIERVLDGWDWVRFHDDRTTIMFAEYRASRRYGQRRIPLLMIFRDGEPVVITESASMEHRETIWNQETGHPSIRSCVIRIDSPGASGELVVTPDEVMHSRDFLADRSAPVRLLARLFLGRPWGVRYRSVIKGRLRLPEEELLIQGEGVFQELLYLR